MRVVQSSPRQKEKTFFLNLKSLIALSEGFPCFPIECPISWGIAGALMCVCVSVCARACLSVFLSVPGVCVHDNLRHVY